MENTLNEIARGRRLKLYFCIEKAPFEISDRVLYDQAFKEYLIYTKRFYENGIHDEEVEEWLSYCKLEENKNLPKLDRTEGGVGGNDNRQHKQIRPVMKNRSNDINIEPSI